MSYLLIFLNFCVSSRTIYNVAAGVNLWQAYIPAQDFNKDGINEAEPSTSGQELSFYTQFCWNEYFDSYIEAGGFGYNIYNKSLEDTLAFSNWVHHYGLGVNIYPIQKIKKVYPFLGAGVGCYDYSFEGHELYGSDYSYYYTSGAKPMYWINTGIYIDIWKFVSAKLQVRKNFCSYTTTRGWGVGNIICEKDWAINMDVLEIGYSINIQW
jgi:hypothetical protein